MRLTLSTSGFAKPRPASSSTVEDIVVPRVEGIQHVRQVHDGFHVGAVRDISYIDLTVEQAIRLRDELDVLLRNAQREPEGLPQTSIAGDGGHWH